MAPSIQEINGLSYEEFSSLLANVVEHCSLCAAAVWALRPFNSIQDLHVNMCNFIDQLPDIGKQGILRLHPDLAGRMAKLGLLTNESKQEQLAAGLDGLTEEEGNTMQELNQRYKAKFGFPFVICARENKKDAILNGLATRVENSAETELTTGIEEVKKIMLYRLIALVSSDS